MIQKLRLKSVKAKALAAYEAGLLLAQHPKKAKRNCVYEDGDCHCGIGAALSEATLKKIRSYDESRSYSKLNESNVETLNANQIIELPEIGPERDEINIVQSLHDDWANHSRALGARHRTTIQARDIFVAKISA